MEMGLRADIKQTQQLRMTPQLQQAIKLLQLNRMELISLVRQEMTENPILEEIQEPYEAESLYVQEHGIRENDKEDKTEEVKADESDIDNVDWEDYINKYSADPMPTNSYKGYSTTDLPGYEQTMSTSESLVDHLMTQLRMSALDEDEQQIGMLIIGNLDPDGYLREATTEQIAEDIDAPLEQVEGVLSVIQEFDPTGVAARNLKECLQIQADLLFPENDLLHTIIDEHLSDLERKSVSKISRAIGVSKDEVITAAKLITTLEPKPGRLYNDEEGRYITPDVYIFKMDGEWVTSLNEDGLPKLKISNYYKKQLQKKKDEGTKDDVREYIQDKLRGAMWLIRSIHQRQSTIIKVTESIIKFQKDFFEKGVEHLKPLVLKDVADDIEMHESTVSRVTTNKYVHTPRGVFELKFFFNSAITKHGGEDLASEAVKAKIREIIANEPGDKPLSDSKIVDILAEENIDIARRTVAKYREMMGILSSSKRKQVF
jgi:RNA polymerase sigma-54 factor